MATRDFERPDRLAILRTSIQRQSANWQLQQPAFVLILEVGKFQDLTLLSIVPTYLALMS